VPSTPLIDAPPESAAPPAAAQAAEKDEPGLELLLYGNEQILRASDNGVLVAFAALAFQQIRGGSNLPHFNVGFGILIISVLMCGVVHFAMGSFYIGRGRRLIRGDQEKLRHRLSRGFYASLAWSAGLVQLLCIVVGLILVLNAEPPEFLSRYVLKYFIDPSAPDPE
jgi:hypothetical protein